MSDHNKKNQVTFRQLLTFFAPLGLSASLVTISHVIINSTLARSNQPEMVIASYALPLSLLNVAERPALLLRQTCSVLVRDRQSFRAMSVLTLYVLGAVFLADILFCYTSMGPLVFKYWFGADDRMLDSMLQIYRLLMFVTVFSGIRCVFQGLIIANMRTKWLTIGMLIRLSGMYFLSLYFIRTDHITSGIVGAIIFLTGMIIEAAVSFWEGGRLLKTIIPHKVTDHPIERPSQIFHFYKPLLFSTFIAAILEPSINAFLGKTTGVQFSIASFAIAASLTELVQSFFSYIHQIVLHFYRKAPSIVLRFVFAISLIPSLLIAILAYSPIGPWFLEHIIGINALLMQDSIATLRVFMIMTLLSPWLDFFNGLLMLYNQTKVFLWSQAMNVFTTLLTLILCISLVPNWNGMIGALALSFGILTETLVKLFAFKRMNSPDYRKAQRIRPPLSGQ